MKGTFSRTAKYRFHCAKTGHVHEFWESLSAIAADQETGFNRADYLRALPQNTDEYARVYGMRQDTESLNNQLEQAFYRNRLPSWGLERQLVAILLASLALNSWALYVFDREHERQHPPPAAA